MESQLQHTHGRHYDEQDIPTSQHTGHNEDEQHHGEKKSVIKKVKEKAKKLKNTITKHGHGHHQHVDDDVDDDDDETVEDPEVHGAPMYDSARVGLGGPDAILAQPRGNLERPSVMAEDRYTKPVASHDAPPTVSTAAFGTNLSQQSGLGGHQHQVYGQEDVNPEKWRSKIGQPTGMEEEVPFAPNPTRVPTPITEQTYGTKHAFDPFENHGQDMTHGGLKSSIGKSTGMMKDPHAPSGLGSGSDPANYETKVTNPTHTGGKEAGLSQMQHSFDKMGIHDSGSKPKRYHPENLPRDTLTGNQSSQSSNCTEKISSTASAIAEKAAVAKDVKNTGSTATEYAHKITDKVTETLAPVYEKVVDTGSSVISKVQGTVSGTGQQQMHGTETSKGTDKGVSVKEYLVETLRPGDEDKALSNVITHAFHKGNQEEFEKKSGEERPMGRVTESVEVRTRLGTDYREGKQQQSGNVTANKNVTERLSDAMGSWFGGKGNAPQGTLGTSYVTDQGLSSNPTGNEDKGRGRGQ